MSLHRTVLKEGDDYPLAVKEADWDGRVVFKQTVTVTAYPTSRPSQVPHVPALVIWWHDRVEYVHD